MVSTKIGSSVAKTTMQLAYWAYRSQHILQCCATIIITEP